MKNYRFWDDIVFDGPLVFFIFIQFGIVSDMGNDLNTSYLQRHFFFLRLTLLFFIKRMISSCINLACFLLSSTWLGVKWSDFVEESLFSPDWKQNLQNFTIGRQITFQNAKIAENGTGKYNSLGQSKYSIKALVISHFQYNNCLFWNLWIVEFIRVIVKFSKMKMAIMW